MPKVKFFAVCVGREGAKIYDTWSECQKNVTRYPGAKHKSFPTMASAQEWIDGHLMQTRSNRQRPPPDVEVIVIDSDSDTSVIPRSPVKKTLYQKPAVPRYDSDDTDMEIEIISSLPRPTSKESTKIQLSPEQEAVLRRVKSGQSVFFTGSAGTGKSLLLQEIIKSLRDSGKVIAVTASTGIASVNIGGCTLHSWAGIGLGQEEAKKLAMKLLGQKSPATKRWRITDTLIIDEISMIDGKLFDKLEEVGRLVRHSTQPFGGLQLILSGDFCQLPPVPNRKGNEVLPVTFAFDSKSWKACVGSPIILSRVFRQKDQRFVDMLNAMRFGEMNDEYVTTFHNLSRKVTYTDGIEATEIYSLRAEVERANTSRLNKLRGESFTYRAREFPGIDVYGKPTSKEQMDKLLQRLVVPQDITLKVGAQVMLLKNLEQGYLVNGSVGTVTDFVTAAEALEAHMAVGVPPGQDDPAAAIRKLPAMQKWPVVRFTNGRILVCIPQDFNVENCNGDVEAKRDQVPLILAWALSVHKSQGQTLNRVKVDLKTTFEKGQAYVALSRATTLEHLEVINFNSAKVMAHPRVIEWAKGLATDAMDGAEYFEMSD